MEILDPRPVLCQLPRLRVSKVFPNGISTDRRLDKLLETTLKSFFDLAASLRIHSVLAVMISITS
jgi:hypothetical protein